VPHAWRRMAAPDDIPYSSDPYSSDRRRNRRSRPSLLYGLAGGALGAGLRPARYAATVAGRVEREGRRAATELAGRLLLGIVDRAIASPYAERAVDRVLGSALAEHAVGRALSGPLTDAAARDVVRYAVVERVADEVLAGEVVERLIDRAETAGVPERVVARLVDSPAIERAAGQIIESPLLDQVVARLLESEDLWLVVDEIAQSPAVTAAITQQGLGFADQVAGEVNERTRRADTSAETIARRLLRRGARARPADVASETGAR
jgi:hypothetical protein